MNEAIKVMLKAYGTINNSTDRINFLKEVIQQVSLLGLSRGDFFNKAGFYGGTALRILYGLDRFSEDMDFCLKEKDLNFSLEPYFENISSELERYGFSASINLKKTGSEFVIESAFIKQDTLSGLLVVGDETKGAQKGQLIKVKIEIDKSNPPGAKFCKKLVKLPVPFMVGSMTEESLFAGKLHALIARSYSNRVKGRDYYDFLFYLSRSTKINLPYLEAKLRDSGHLKGKNLLTIDRLKQILVSKFESVDFAKAKQDVLPFVKPNKVLDVENWSLELFIAMTESITGDMQR